MEFFRHCPGCGRRFHVVLVGKQLSHVEKEEVRVPPRVRSTMNPVGGGVPIIGPGGTAGRGRLIIEPGGTVTLDIDEFQYSYKCNRCGHEWSEKHTEKHLDPDQEY